jgi:DNA polymerase-3 subunit epsilon
MERTPPFSFAAIDFETADPHPASACAVAIVRVRGGIVIQRGASLFPPSGRPRFQFAELHGIDARAVKAAPEATETLEWMERWSRGIHFFAAHNAPFDRAAFTHMRSRGRPRARSDVPWLCTVELARAVWGIHPTTLPSVCERLGISLQHHDPLSDASACAAIVMRALEDEPQLPMASFFVSEIS